MNRHKKMSAIGQRLWELLCKGVADAEAAHGPRPRNRRTRATFIETESWEHLRGTIGLQGVQGEFSVVTVTDNGLKRTRIDYVSVQQGALKMTCEVKGPARSSIFLPGKKNYYEQRKGKALYGIKPDLLKQHELVTKHPNAEHNVFWIAEGQKTEDIDRRLAGLIARLRADLPLVPFQEVARQAIRNEFGVLWIILSRVY